MRRLAPVLLIGLWLAGLAAAPAARADEGMWTFDNAPTAAIKAKYGVDVDQAWLDHLRASTLRLSVGCSASIVSAGGLVLTNHHCAADCLQALSDQAHDYLAGGFAADARAEERQCPGLEAELLQSITDVTPAVRKASAGKTGRDFILTRDAAVADIEHSRCAGQEARLRCQVIGLYQGGQYALYVFRRFDDVRLVFAPETRIAYFGGDPDNFNFPRYDLDVTFLRLYVDGKPAATPDHLRWTPRAPVSGEPVFVVGNPGTTDRLFTVDQLLSLRDVALPQTLTRLAEERGLLTRFREESAEHARVASDDLFGVENSYKAYLGEFRALVSPGFLDARRTEEAALRARVAADPALTVQTGDSWDEIARAQAAKAGLYAAYTFVERGGADSELYDDARSLVRAAQERAKPSDQRLPEYADSRLASLRENLLAPRPVDRDLERLKLAFWLSKLREALTADAPETRAFLGAESPEALADRLSASSLADPAVREALWDGGLEAVKASKDPMIAFVLATDPTARRVRSDYEQQVSGPTDRAQQRIAQARFALFGLGAYPDATFSPRLSYGAVAGWTDQGVTTAPFTDFAGLYGRATGADPFALPPRWLAAKDRLNPATIFNFTTTNDIVGGNSGSPVVDAKGNVIGAVFDGDILSLGGAFAYDGRVNRAVAVSAAAVSEALAKVYGQEALAAELAAP